MPLLILQVQSDLALVHCPSINRNNPEGETNKQTSGGGTCRGTDAGGSVELHNMWSLICNASEMHWKSAEFNTQGCTLTSHIPRPHPCLMPCPHQSRVLSPPKASSSPSMIHDHTFAAAWRDVGGCCFYEGKGPL